MSSNPNPVPQTVSDTHYRILKITSALVYLLVVLGGIVCITDSSSACPDWPWCYGRLIPPLEVKAIIEYTHRFFTMVTSFFLIATLVMGWVKTPKVKPLKWLPVLTLLLTGAVSFFGARVVLSGLTPIQAAMDLGFALLVLAVMLVTTMVAYAYRENPGALPRFSFKRPLTSLSFLTSLLIFAVLDSGVLVAQKGSVIRCVGWPMYFGQLAPSNINSLPHIARLILAAIASLIIIYLVVQTRKTSDKSSPIRRTANVLGLFFAFEILIGIIMIAVGYQIVLLGFFVVSVVALWGASVILSALLGFSETS
jgi:cytochrome c oxidase assembly protein subunit 15